MGESMSSQYAGELPMNVPSYISGYVDGEGCFTVSFSRRVAMRGGWEVRPSFSVSQNGDRAEVLHLLMEYFECGFIRPDRSDRTLKFEVRDIANLVGRVIPHFEGFPLLSGKQKDFESFAAICRLVRAKAHLTHAGLREIVGLAMDMNGCGKRKFSAAEILEHHSSKL
jgi:LAGLIDADG DNA endonuclease family protein